MSRNLKGLLRFAMEHSDGTSESNVDPEKAQWLREAIANTSVDLTQRLKADINALVQLIDAPSSNESEMEEILQDMISLTEDINLANDFFKLGGASLLRGLFFQGPSSLKPGAYELLAAVTQNNPVTQEICANSNVLEELVSLLPKEKDLECLKKLMLAISCLTRGHLPSVTAFQQANGFESILDVLMDLLRDEAKTDAGINRVCVKGAFLIYSLLQEVLPSSMDAVKEGPLASKLVQVAMMMPDAQEHLLASLLLLFSDCPSLDSAIDTENLPKFASKRANGLLSRHEIATFVDWLKVSDVKVTSSNDPAHAELRTYIGALLHLLSSRPL
ncbi:hypothetical protein CRM22_003239 [Opisthorchis felineus]|uniref:Nucleotide exchange factor Fes1 domain-containing protein n=1 Tax=Opisthorchis felineus TaxID=147828 RepID=A0A4S2M288_OPIFE|nr:hypothetical protein CRM22_003239 [Opisthorchis felineus]